MEVVMFKKLIVYIRHQIWRHRCCRPCLAFGAWPLEKGEKTLSFRIAPEAPQEEFSGVVRDLRHIFSGYRRKQVSMCVHEDRTFLIRSITLRFKEEYRVALGVKIRRLAESGRPPKIPQLLADGLQEIGAFAPENCPDVTNETF